VNFRWHPTLIANRNIEHGHCPSLEKVIPYFSFPAKRVYNSGRPEDNQLHAESLTTAQLAGQRLMVGFSGTELSGDLKFLIDTVKVGGVILFARNIQSPAQVGNLCRSIQNYALSCSQPPLFIAVDQEGGVVARLKAPFTEFPGNPAIQTENDAARFGDITGHELADAGINMNMAPVMDVAPEGSKSIMAERVFGHDPEHVAQMGKTVIRHLQKNGIMAVAKHFPGIGKTSLDSHLDLPTLASELSEIEAFDLIPFKTAIANQAAGIMLSHIRYTGIDPDWPASLSFEITAALLRRKLGFKGLVLTDDLDMGAIAKHYDIYTIIQRVLQSTVDMALICHPGPAIEAARDAIHGGIKTNRHLYQQTINSAKRIAALKNHYIIQKPRGGHETR